MRYTVMLFCGLFTSAIANNFAFTASQPLLKSSGNQTWLAGNSPNSLTKWFEMSGTIYICFKKKSLDKMVDLHLKLREPPCKNRCHPPPESRGFPHSAPRSEVDSCHPNLWMVWIPLPQHGLWVIRQGLQQNPGCLVGLSIPGPWEINIWLVVLVLDPDISETKL